MDDSISFGEVEQAQPDEHQRPDQNYHFAVVEVGEVSREDLPIYIDIDSALDIESHAQVDTNIELGGVLLGGQYIDNEGNPFVLVRDSLRAEDYEATKSSFKFTHETWEKISRQKDRFPQGTEIVGWYHTHPDWGVFLSGMDMFICNGFFNRPLDVALVVDPCRDTRGWFHWTQQNGETVKRETSGFYLFGSRFRQAEMEQTAQAMLSKEGNSMVTQQRFTQTTGTQPIIHLHQPDNRWMGLAVLSMLLMQTLLVAGAIYLMMDRRQGNPQTSEAYRQVIAELLPEDEDPARRAARLDQLIARQSEIEQVNAKLETISLGASSLIKDNQTLQQKIADYSTKNETLTLTNSSQKEELKTLRKIKDEVDKAKIEGEQASLISWWTNWINLAAVALVAAGIFFGGMITATYKSDELSGNSDIDQELEN